MVQAEQPALRVERSRVVEVPGYDGLRILQGSAPEDRLSCQHVPGAFDFRGSPEFLAEGFEPKIEEGFTLGSVRGSSLWFFSSLLSFFPSYVLALGWPSVGPRLALWLALKQFITLVNRPIYYLN